jgi:CRISPR/Cas system-associated exonuclease Cas4 (RecB family)
LNLVGLIYQNARVLREKETKREGDPRLYRVSEAGECARQIALRKLNTPTERTEEAVDWLRLEDGHMHHNHLRSVVARLPGVYLTDVESSEVIFAELPGLPPITITGHCDGIIHGLDNGARYILEIKGLNRFSAQKIKNNDYESLKEVYPKAIPQARLYSFMYDTAGALILIKSKDTAELKQVVIPRDDAKAFKIIERFSKIAKAIQDNNIPPCDYLKKDRRCTYCPFTSKCGR